MTGNNKGRDRSSSPTPCSLPPPPLGQGTSFCRSEMGWSDTGTRRRPRRRAGVVASKLRFFFFFFSCLCVCKPLFLSPQSPAPRRSLEAPSHPSASAAKKMPCCKRCDELTKLDPRTKRRMGSSCVQPWRFSTSREQTKKKAEKEKKKKRDQFGLPRTGCWHTHRHTHWPLGSHSTLGRIQRRGWLKGETRWPHML